MIRLVLALLILGATPVAAESLVARQTIKAGTILTDEVVTVSERAFPGAVTDRAALLGRETLNVVYAGRPFFANQLGAPTLVQRNALVTLLFTSGGMEISTTGRALGRAARGEVVKVLNTASHETVYGVVRDRGLVVVGTTERTKDD